MILKWWTLNDIIAFFGTGFFKRHWRSFCWCWVNLSFSHHTTVKPVNFFLWPISSLHGIQGQKILADAVINILIPMKYIIHYSCVRLKFRSGTQISIRDPNFDSKPKFRSEMKSKFRSETQISIRDPNLSPGSKFESRIEISTWHMNRVLVTKIDTTNFLLIKLWKILLSNLTKVSQNFV